jgi:arabinogalactan endo-1,4-beta-galactosidase
MSLKMINMKILQKLLLSVGLLSVALNAQTKKIYLGADLSYVNEIEDCGAFYRDAGATVDPFELFSQRGSNLVRVRLWHNPQFSPYSNLDDVSRTIERAKANKMAVLLDFHYSDTWADPGKQITPKAWAHISDLQVLGDSVYNYTYKTLIRLAEQNLLPEMVQVGNETNSEILQPDEKAKDNIDWKRNSFLLNKGIQAVRSASKKLKTNIGIMLHIAQPENALQWFADAKTNGVTDYDWIGLSYYPLWSKIKFDGLPDAISTLIKTYRKDLMIVETSYPYSLTDVDHANNILTEKSLLDGYPATPQGQKKYMIDLTGIVLKAGGRGVIYWEPAWVSSSCKTMWGEGSHWDNATFFDASNENEALPAFDYYNLKNYQ